MMMRLRQIQQASALSMRRSDIRFGQSSRAGVEPRTDGHSSQASTPGSESSRHFPRKYRRAPTAAIISNGWPNPRRALMPSKGLAKSASLNQPNLKPNE